MLIAKNKNVGLPENWKKKIRHFELTRLVLMLVAWVRKTYGCFYTREPILVLLMTQ